MANSDLEPIVIELDYPDNYAQIRQLPGNFNGMQGDTNVPLDLLFTKNRRPFNLKGFKVGWQQTNAKNETLDITGTTEDTAGIGRIRFIFPSNVFAVAGQVTGNFYITQGTNMRIYGGPMNFNVSENTVQMAVNTTPFRTDWEAFKASLQADYDSYDGKLKNLSDAADGVNTKLDTANDTADMLLKLVKQNQVVTESKLPTLLTDYPKKSDLTNYAKKTDLNSYAKTTALSAYLKTTDFAKQFKAANSLSWQNVKLNSGVTGYLRVATVFEEAFILDGQLKPATSGKMIPANFAKSTGTMLAGVKWAFMPILARDTSSAHYLQIDNSGNIGYKGDATTQINVSGILVK